MPEFDAFGREINDDPLAKLRAATVEPVRAPTAPAPAPVAAAPVTAPPVAPEPVFEPPAPVPPQFVRPPRKRRRGLAALLVILAIVVGIAWFASVVVVRVEDGVNGIKGVIRGPDAAAAPPTGVQGASLIRRDNFADAMDTLKKSGLGRPILLRVAPDRIDATLVDGTRTHQVQIGPGGELRELGSSSGTDRATIAYKLLDPAAPANLVRAGSKRAHVRARRIDYLVLTGNRPLQWGAYFKGGKIVIGDAHGRPQRVL